MAYNSDGKRPFEHASRSNHIHIIKDEEVQAFLNNHALPSGANEIGLIENNIVSVDFNADDAIEYIIAIDGGNTIVPVKTQFPSSTLTFFQFGANLIPKQELKNLKLKPFISPDDISKLKDLQRIKFALPTKNIGLKLPNGNRATLEFSVRRAIYDFFKKQDYLPTLKWFLFREYLPTASGQYFLASHPNNPLSKNIEFKRENLTQEYILPHADGDLFLTDVFRLHEVIDEDLGASGIIAYLQNLIEHFVLISTIRGIYRRKKHRLKELLFIKDGPLGFFGQTANMHEPMRDLISFLSKELTIYLVGIEKSGPFVEHAQEIKSKIPQGSAYLLANSHIYRYIKPGDPSNSQPYGASSYYSAKLFFHSRDGRIYVITLPTLSDKVVLKPVKGDFLGIDVILKYIEQLKSDMYDNSLLPIALVNKLVSLSDHPSSTLLEKFAKDALKH
jgi:hypothetical protein